jgi:hypothetical protein
MKTRIILALIIIFLFSFSLTYIITDIKVDKEEDEKNHCRRIPYYELKEDLTCDAMIKNDFPDKKLEKLNCYFGNSTGICYCSETNKYLEFKQFYNIKDKFIVKKFIVKKEKEICY